MNRSSKYGFYLPQNTDPISVSDFNYNFQLIDDNLGVANNLSTTESGYVLDARQGKAIGDKISGFECINTGVNANSSYSLDLNDGDAFLIHQMTSSDVSARCIIVSRRDTYYEKLTLAAGSYQTYYSETLGNGKWTISPSYYTVLRILKL